MKYGKSVEKLFVYEVAPLVGAWIEILVNLIVGTSTTSLLSWERGLKFQNVVVSGLQVKVAPLVGAWIEMSNGTYLMALVTMSLLSWERGLKLSLLDN